jgi:hypothetical protein
MRGVSSLLRVRVYSGRRVHMHYGDSACFDVTESLLSRPIPAHEASSSASESSEPHRPRRRQFDARDDFILTKDVIFPEKDAHHSLILDSFEEVGPESAPSLDLDAVEDILKQTAGPDDSRLLALQRKNSSYGKRTMIFERTKACDYRSRRCLRVAISMKRSGTN